MGLFENRLEKSDQTSKKKSNDDYILDLQKRVERINQMESQIETLGDDELVAKTKDFRTRLITNGEDVNGPILEEAFAVVREAAW